MNWLNDTFDRLSRFTPGGYHLNGPLASEPTAWAAIAFSNANRKADALSSCQWLAECQTRSGAVGVTKEQSEPAWPTSLAMLAWRDWQVAAGDNRFQKNFDRAAEWALNSRGRTSECKPEIGHDTSLVGWSWAADTHSWLEPTAMFVRALRSAGYGDHPRTREAVRLMVDRLLPAGGANYGNTRVLDQYLPPHAQPTGLVLWALAGEHINDPRISASLDYLQRVIQKPLGAASLAYAVIGLKAQGHSTEAYETLLSDALETQAVQSSPYKLALLANAALAVHSV